MDTLYTLLLGTIAFFIIITALYLVGRLAFKVHYSKTQMFRSFSTFDFIIIGGWSLIVVGVVLAVLVLLLGALGTGVRTGLHI